MIEIYIHIDDSNLYIFHQTGQVEVLPVRNLPIDVSAWLNYFHNRYDKRKEE